MDRITKSGLVDKIVNSEDGQASGITKRMTKTALDLILAQIKAEVAAGNKVALTDFGTFEANTVKEHMGRNPQTNQPKMIPEHRRVKFSVGKSFKDAVK